LGSRRGSLNTATLRRPDPGLGLRVEVERAFYTNDPIADLNADGVVNFADLAIMKKSFFKKPGPAAGKP